jgi:hypothetical protein
MPYSQFVVGVGKYGSDGDSNPRFPTIKVREPRTANSWL